MTAERKARRPGRSATRRPGRSATRTMVPDIVVPCHSWLCRSTERSCTLCALVSAASGDRPVHQWCGQKTSAGKWASQLHSVLTAIGVWDKLVCRLAHCCHNQAVSEPVRLPVSEECPSVLVDGSVVGQWSTAILFAVPTYNEQYRGASLSVLQVRIIRSASMYIMNALRRDDSSGW